MMFRTQLNATIDDLFFTPLFLVRVEQSGKICYP
jgi:hypothetical protein